MSLPVLCAKVGPADAPRTHCAGCGCSIVRPVSYGPLAKYLCPPCSGLEMRHARAEGRMWLGAFQGAEAIEALSAFLASGEGRPN